MPKSISLYLHIPFCRHRCPYCDFVSYAGKEALIPDYLDALRREVELWGAALRRGSGQAPALDNQRTRVETIFFGGGTPSLLSSQQVGHILETSRNAFELADAVEISLEANPGTLSPESLLGLRQQGVNRLSLGVQSFDDDLLRAMGRLHDAAQARQAFHWARAAAFDNINLDLIYGLPGQTLAQWQADIEEALLLGPEHLSLYALGIEEGTPWGEAVAAGRLTPPDSDLAADMYLWAEDRLQLAGYNHYEISNWARPGRQCHHNLTYWQRCPYLGLGAGAHSFVEGWRFANSSDLERYIAAFQGSLSPPPPLQELAGWGPVSQVETLSETDELAETLILGLRLETGVDLGQLPVRWRPQLDALANTMADLVSWGLLERVGSRLCLTQRGRLLGNEVFWRLLPTDHRLG